MVASAKTTIAHQILDDFESALAEVKYSLSTHSGKRLTSSEFKDQIHVLTEKGRVLGNALTSSDKRLSEEILKEVKKIFKEVYGRKTLYNKSVRKLEQAFIFEVVPKFGGVQQKIAYTEFVPSSLLTKLPAQVRDCIKEAMKCFNYRCYIASSVMLRKALEVAAEIRVKQAGKTSELYDKDGNELTLPKKLALVAQLEPGVRKNTKDVDTVKWFGDIGAHDPNTPVFARDIKDNVAPKIRAYLSNLGLK
jgi:hypothetical protein